jgi:pyruvate dehydrogenase E2 component (dihydrolipoamide acetyltransferase)
LGRGLDVPVIRNADRLDLAALSVACRGAVDRAKADQSAPDERAGASATVSNLGAHGITAGTPVINGPEALLAFMGAVQTSVQERIQRYYNYMDGIRAGTLDVWKLPKE